MAISASDWIGKKEGGFIIDGNGATWMIGAPVADDPTGFTSYLTPPGSSQRSEFRFTEGNGIINAAGISVAELNSDKARINGK